MIKELFSLLRAIVFFILKRFCFALLLIALILVGVSILGGPNVPIQKISYSKPYLADVVISKAKSWCEKKTIKADVFMREGSSIAGTGLMYFAQTVATDMANECPDIQGIDFVIFYNSTNWYAFRAKAFKDNEWLPEDQSFDFFSAFRITHRYMAQFHDFAQPVAQPVINALQPFAQPVIDFIAPYWEKFMGFIKPYKDLGAVNRKLIIIALFALAYLGKRWQTTRRQRKAQIGLYNHSTVKPTKAQSTFASQKTTAPPED